MKDVQMGPKIGEGTYGAVYRCRLHGELCAAKKMRNDPLDGVKVETYREVATLRQLNEISALRRYVIRLVECYYSYAEVTMLTECMDVSLHKLLSGTERPFPIDNVDVTVRDALASQLVRAVDYVHQAGYIHRDIKPENILLRQDGTLKLCDFGMSRTWHVHAVCTPDLVTIWWRAYEILLGYEDYGPGVDVWAVGIVLVQLYTDGRVPWSSDFEIGMLFDIFQAIGTPREASCSRAPSTPECVVGFPNFHQRKFSAYMDTKRSSYATVPRALRDVVDGMLAYRSGRSSMAPCVSYFRGDCETKKPLPIMSAADATDTFAAESPTHAASNTAGKRTRLS